MTLTFSKILESLPSYRLVHVKDKATISSTNSDAISKFEDEIRKKGFETNSYYSPNIRKHIVEIKDVSKRNISNIEALADEIFSMNESRKDITTGKLLDPIEVFQIDLSDVHDDINELGWSKAADKYPEVDAHLAVTLKGSKNWKPEFFKSYKRVAEISNEVQQLEDVFRIMNVGDKDKVKPFGKYHSLSIGDILKKDGKYYMVDPFGFNEVKVK